ncbi:carbohydrate esterase family 4 protein [Backusella circina FSU 941]|nr:carbohydrate esterase family 4 protein [Backusella circina FSU 941]
MYIKAYVPFFLSAGYLVSASIATATATTTSTSILAVESPNWLPTFETPSGVNSGYPTGKLNTSSALSHKSLNLSAYPEPWGKLSTTHPEVKAVIAAIDWSKVPKAPVRKVDSKGDMVMTGYSADKDPYCWWSDTNCVKPKASYLPSDISYCPNPTDWGLNYDDGPLNPSGDKELDKWAEPELYNFLAKNNNQKATLFYIGSNVATFPEAAKRALNDGHTICVHTWSHPQMTTKSNYQVVAELYWTLRAIKEATGITTKCWRPPYGDVDDRVRAIAWQMGMRTIIWDQDTNDWNMPGDGGGNLSPSTVDGYFGNWIKKGKTGADKHGHIVLEHELNNATVKMTEKWLPRLQGVFNVVPIHKCMNVSQPYWENNWIYPTEQDEDGFSNTSISSTTTGSITESTFVVESGPSTKVFGVDITIKSNLVKVSSASAFQSSCTTAIVFTILSAVLFF